jgi:hypothetical protein
VLTPIPEGSSARYTATLLDELGAGVPAASLTTLTLTLYDDKTGAIINGRNAQNVLNANGVSVDASGNLVWAITPADTPIVTDTLQTETHYAVFKATWSSGAKGLSHAAPLTVTNMWRRP